MFKRPEKHEIFAGKRKKFDAYEAFQAFGTERIEKQPETGFKFTHTKKALTPTVRQELTKLLSDAVQDDRAGKYIHMEQKYRELIEQLSTLFNNHEISVLKRKEMFTQNLVKIAYLNRGLACLWQKDYLKAINYFSQLLILEPDNIHALYYRGCTYITINRNTLAINDFTSLSMKEEYWMLHLLPAENTTHLDYPLNHVFYDAGQLSYISITGEEQQISIFDVGHFDEKLTQLQAELIEGTIDKKSTKTSTVSLSPDNSVMQAACRQDPYLAVDTDDDHEELNEQQCHVISLSYEQICTFMNYCDKLPSSLKAAAEFHLAFAWKDWRKIKELAPQYIQSLAANVAPNRQQIMELYKTRMYAATAEERLQCIEVASDYYRDALEGLGDAAAIWFQEELDDVHSRLQDMHQTNWHQPQLKPQPSRSGFFQWIRAPRVAYLSPETPGRPYSTTQSDKGSRHDGTAQSTTAPTVRRRTQNHSLFPALTSSQSAPIAPEAGASDFIPSSVISGKLK